MTNCNFCGKELEIDTDCWHIDEYAEDYCYHDINTKEDIHNSCVGKELLKCGYSEEYILALFKHDLEERAIAIYYTTVAD